ncbi:unnamed protein product, partial [Ceratitis capitata]
PKPPHGAVCHAHANDNAKVRAHVAVAAAHVIANVTCAETCVATCCASTMFGPQPMRLPMMWVSLRRPTPNVWRACATTMARAAKWFLSPPTVYATTNTAPYPVLPWPLPPPYHPYRGKHMVMVMAMVIGRATSM